jgi:hypothetical protein
MKKKSLVLWFILTIFFLSPQFATGEEKRSFVSAKSGFIFFTGDLEDENSSGFYSELAYGYFIHPNIILEGAIGYFHDGVSYGNEISGFPVTVTVKGILHIDKIEPFIGSGCGMYFTKDRGWIHGSFVDGNENIFGGHLLAGMDYQISSSIAAGIEGKYIFTEKAGFSGVKVNLDAIVTILRLSLSF